MDPTTELDVASEPFGVAPDAVGLVADRLRIDVRRRPVFEQASTLLPGAQWHDPADVAGWVGTLPTDLPVLVYCVHGHAVSRGVLLQLREAGIDASFLLGGIAAWQAAGWPLAAKEAAA